MKAKRQSIHDSAQDRAFSWCVNILLAFALLVTAYPLIFVFSASFSEPSALLQGRVVLWPVGFSFEGYRAAFRYPDIWTGFANSALYAVCGTALSLVVTVLCAYPLSRRDLAGRAPLTFLFAFTMWFSGGLIPTYLVVKELGMLNTRWAMVLPGALGVYNMLIVKNSFSGNLPGELLESCKIDGCSDYRFLLQFAVPLSKPVLAVIALFNIVGFWNAYFYALVYLNDRSLYPLQIFLREILVMNKTDSMLSGMELSELARREQLSELIKYALIVISSAPILMMYPFIQRFFVKGIMVGSIKG